MFLMCQAMPSILVAALLLCCWATPQIAAAHVGQAAGPPQQCPAGDEIGFIQTHVDAHTLSNAEPSAASSVSTHGAHTPSNAEPSPALSGSTRSVPSYVAELRDVLVELNNSNNNQEFPAGFGGIVGQMVEDTLCKKASVLAQPAITKCENTLAKVTHLVDHLLNSTLEAGQALTNSSGNSSHDLATRLEKFENYSNRVLGLGVEHWRTMYEMLNPMAEVAIQALEDAGMHSLAHNLRLDKVNKTMHDVLRVYQAAQRSVHGIGNKSMNEAGITLKQLNETMTTGLSGVDAFAQALNESFGALTNGLGTSLASLLPKSCGSIWKQPLASAGLTLTSITLKVQDSVHRLASDLLQAGELLGIEPIAPTEPPLKGAGSRFIISRPVTLSVMAAAAAALAGFPG